MLDRHRTHRTGRRRLLALGFAAILGLGVGCGEETPPAEPVAQPVKTFRVGGAGSGGTLEFPGEVSPSQNAEPAFEVAGKMIEFPVDEGQFLAEGDVIAKLDPRDYEAEVERARANVNKTRTDLTRYKTLFEKGVSPKTDYEGALRRFEVTDADLKKAEKALEDSTLRAPFAGTVARKLVQDFQNVQAKQPIVILQDDSSLEIVVDIPESDFARIRPGLTIEERNRLTRSEVEIASIPNRRFPASIKEFATTADPVTRTFSATFRFDSPEDVNVRPGMTAKVIVTPPAETRSAPQVSIPARAVRTDDTDEPFVWVVDPSTMRVSRTPVTTGELSGDRIEILSGLAAGAEIVTSGVYQVRDGMEVRRFEP